MREEKKFRNVTDQISSSFKYKMVKIKITFKKYRLDSENM